MVAIALQVVTASRRFGLAGEERRSRSNSFNAAIANDQAELERKEAELVSDKKAIHSVFPIHSVGWWAWIDVVSLYLPISRLVQSDSDFYQTADEEEMAIEVKAAKEKMMGKRADNGGLYVDSISP